MQKLLFDFGWSANTLAFRAIDHMTFRELELVARPTSLREMILQKNETWTPS